MSEDKKTNPSWYKKGHVHAGDVISKLSESHKKLGTKPPSRKGIRHSEEYKKELSKIASEKGFGKWMTGKKRSEETKKKIREHRTGQVLSESAKQKLRKRNVDNKSKFLGGSKKDTKIELLMQAELERRGICFIKQHGLCDVTVCDFYIPAAAMALFCDGNYWHNLPKAKERDSRINKTLSESGYTVARFWEKDILKSISDCVDSLNLIP